MTRLTTIQTNFANGELDPLLAGRADLKAYQNGAKRVRDCSRRATGGLERRPGTYDLNAISQHARMAEFEFSNAERYVLAFSALRLEIFDLGGTLLQTINTCPWTDAQLFEIDYSQLGDVMVIWHIDFTTQVLTRTGATTFVLSTFAFEPASGGDHSNQPFFKFAPTDMTMKPSASTGAITLTTSAAFFVPQHVGVSFKLYGGEVIVTGVTNSTTATANVTKDLTGTYSLDPFRSSSGGSTVEVTHVFHGMASGASLTIAGANDVGGLTAAMLNGARVITVTSENGYSFVAGGSATTGEDGGGPSVTYDPAGVPTRSWLEQSFSAVRGYPGTGCFHEGRLWMGGTRSQPDGVWGSKALGYFDFDVGKGLDGDSIHVAVGSEDLSRVQHLVSNGELQIYSATGESVFVTPQGQPITPVNVRIKRQSSSGSGSIQPIVFDGATLFIQENGLSVSELVYSDQQASYLATPVSTLAGHLIRRPRAIAASAGLTDRAEPTAYFANEDGTCAVFHSMRLENIAGWGLWTLGAGEIVSACAIGPYVFFCVMVRGAHRLYRLADEQIVQLDGAVHHVSSPAKTNWTLDPRVRGREVCIVTELGHHGMFTIPASGVWVSNVPVENVIAGDNFLWEIETLPPVVSLPAGERVGLRQRIVRAVVLFSDAYSATVNGARVETRYAGEAWDDPITPLNGHHQIGMLGYSRDPTVTIGQEDPLFARVLAVTMEVNV